MILNMNGQLGFNFTVQFALGIAILTMISGCGKKSDVETEMSQQVGDLMASVDESGGKSSGQISRNEVNSAERMFARLDKKVAPLVSYSRDGLELLIPSANAVSCFFAPGFGSCDTNTITRNFNGCTIGAAVLTGSVLLTWGGGASNCQITADNQTITRDPNFSISGRFGGSLVVSKSGTIGQRLTRSAANVFQFTNDGIRRAVSFDGTTLHDYTTTTTGPLAVTGLFRNGRTISSSGGSAVRVTNNLNNVYCDFVPTAVTYSNSCNCAVSGSWGATCSDGKNASIELSGCGSGTFTMDGESSSVTFDRCYGS
jgi:hypothetical protein